MTLVPPLTANYYRQPREGATSKPTTKPAGVFHLPVDEALGAEQMPARLNLDILVVLGTDLAELEGGAHLTVELVLFL